MILSYTFRWESRLFRGGSRATARSKMEGFVIIVNGFQPLTTITRRSILDVAAALDPPLLLLLPKKFHERTNFVTIIHCMINKITEIWWQVYSVSFILFYFLFYFYFILLLQVPFLISNILIFRFSRVLLNLCIIVVSTFFRHVYN